MKKKKKTSKHNFAVDFYGDPTEWQQLAPTGDGHGDGVDLVVDMRVSLLTELQSPLSPLRSIKLEPSGCTLNSTGKCVRLDDCPATGLQLTSTTRETMASVVSPLMLASGWGAKPPMQTTHRTAKTTQLAQQQSNVVTRKQGFLHVLAVPENARVAGFAQDQFLRTVVHRQRRRLFVLEDTVLSELPEDSPGSSSTRALRAIELMQTELREAPTVPTGENDVVLRHSFLLLLCTKEMILVTCESQVDKTSWMLAIRAAASLGKPPTMVFRVSHSGSDAEGSPQFRHSQSVAVSLANRELRRTTVVTGGGVNGRNAIVQERDVLEVEYRIR
jgi:hypothetical protein